MKRNCILFFLFAQLASTRLQSQVAWSLDQAIRTGRQNNLSLAIKSREIIRTKALVNTYQDLDKTSFYFHRDQNNITETGYILNTIGAAQHFKLPSYYKSHKKYLESEVTVAEGLQEMASFELEKNITLVYHELIYLETRKNKVREIDSLYGLYRLAAAKRFERGESTLLEKLLADNKKSEYSLVLEQIQLEIRQAYQQLNYLIQDSSVKTIVVPDSLQLLTAIPLAARSLPGQQVLERINLARQSELDWEKQKWKPELTAEYFMGNNLFNETKFYPGFQLGLALPLWKKAGRAHVDAKSTGNEIARMEAAANRIRLEAQYRELMLQADKYRQTIDYYNRQGLALAAQIQRSADLSFRQGILDFFQYVFAVEEVSRVMQNELAARKSFNETIIHINYLN